MGWEKGRVPRTKGRPIPFHRKRRATVGTRFAMLAAGMIAAGGLIGWQLAGGGGKDKPAPAAIAATDDIGCASPTVVDGDTLRCGSRRIRLSAIDAPEKPGHCNPGRRCVEGDPFASSRHLAQLVSQGPMVCRQVDTDRYGRAVALCSVAGRDLSCAQVDGGYAQERYGDLDC